MTDWPTVQPDPYTVMMLDQFIEERGRRRIYRDAADPRRGV